jgi:hypothetical protein
LGESQLLKMLTLSYWWHKCWWNGPTTQDVGIIYGTFRLP